MRRSKSGPRLVRKYDNRRLYDTGSARYITQGELLDLVANGEDVVVLLQQNDNNTTAETLAEAMYSRIDWTQASALAGLRKIWRRWWKRTSIYEEE